MFLKMEGSLELILNAVGNMNIESGKYRSLLRGGPYKDKVVRSDKIDICSKIEVLRQDATS